MNGKAFGKLAKPRNSPLTSPLRNGSKGRANGLVGRSAAAAAVEVAKVEAIPLVSLNKPSVAASPCEAPHAFHPSSLPLLSSKNVAFPLPELVNRESPDQH